MINRGLVVVLLMISTGLVGCSSISYNAPKEQIKNVGQLGDSIDALLSDADDIEDTSAGIGAVAETMKPYAWNEVIQRLDSVGGRDDVTSVAMPDNSLMVTIPSVLAFGDNNREVQLQASSSPTLNAISQVLLQTVSLRAKIVGHMDNTGDAVDNQLLSLNRAKSVMRYLIAQGVDSKHVTVEGRGVNDPIASNETVRGQQKNQRLEVFLYSVE